MNIEKIISPLVAYQFPSFYRDEGQDFITFVTSYYQWMEQSNNVLNVSRSLIDYSDIDKTLDSFLKFFKNKYVDSLPENIIADKRLVIKHITDLYNAKGTDRGYKLLFRLLFNEDIDIYVPGNYLFKPSDATWFVPTYIEVTSSPYLQDLIGKKIYTSSGGGTAVVESVFNKFVNNKNTNIIYLTSIDGEFKSGEMVLSYDVPQITMNNAPIIFGSLSSISITNGGTNFKVGEVLDVQGRGVGGKVQVVATTNQNGKVSINLLDGGFGYTVNAQIIVSGGSGTGASANIGAIVDKQTYIINTDVINNLYNTTLEYSDKTMELGVENIVGTFSDNNTITSSANVIHLDVDYLTGEVVANETLSNSTLNISGLNVYKADSSVLYITGTDADITNANIAAGIILNASNGAIVTVNSSFPKVTVTGNAQINSAASNSTVLTVFNTTSDIGYFIPGATLTDANTSATADITSVTRKTDWGGFPAAGDITNLDTQLNQALNTQIMEIGQIAYLKNINPGEGYSSNPTITIVEPSIYNLRISDGKGGYWGYDAKATATASNANGIVTAVKVIDSGFNYVPDESVVLSSQTNPTAVSGVSIVDKHGVGRGYSLDNSGFLSDDQYIQDSSYYQSFSYEILASRMIDSYKKLVQDLVHPSGVALYGRYVFKSEVTTSNSQPVYLSLS